MRARALAVALRSTTAPAACIGDRATGPTADSVTLSPPSRLATGGLTTCYLTPGGLPLCWTGVEEGHPVDLHVPGNGDLRLETLHGSATLVCGVARDGGAWCWGRGSLGALGTGVAPSSVPQPVAVSTSARFVELSADVNVCGRTVANTVLCWGILGGTLDPGSIPRYPGDCSTEYYPRWMGDGCRTPTPLAGNPPFTSLSHGRCGVTEAHRVYCWGSGSHGRVGTGIVGSHAFAPVSPSTEQRFREVASGGGYTCALTLDDELWCWGPGYGNRPVQVILPAFDQADGGGGSARSPRWACRYACQLVVATSASSLSNEPVHPCVMPARSATNAARSGAVASPSMEQRKVTRVSFAPSDTKSTRVRRVCGSAGALEHHGEACGRQPPRQVRRRGEEIEQPVAGRLEAAGDHEDVVARAVLGEVLREAVPGRVATRRLDEAPGLTRRLGGRQRHANGEFGLAIEVAELRRDTEHRRAVRR
jgi:hypothetical protein